VTALLDAPADTPVDIAPPGARPVPRPGAHPGAASRLARARPARLPDLLLVLALSGVIVVTHGWHLGAGPGFGDDEGTYTAQAYAVSHFGTLAHYTYWYDHPPLGWLLMTGWDQTLGRLLHPATAVEGGRQFMVAVAAVTGALIFALGRRLGLARWACVAAVLAWALSPLALSYSRMVYLDNVGVAFLLGALVLACSPRRHLWAFAGAGLLLAAAVLSKETLLLSAPAVAAAVWGRSAGKTRPFCVAAFGTTLATVLALYPLFALLKGEFFAGPEHVSLLDALRFQLTSRPSTGSPLSSGSGSAQLVGRWVATDPWLLASSVLLAPLALAVRRLRVPALAVAVPVLVGLRPGYLPDPYVVALLAPGALVVAGLLDGGVRQVATRLGGRVVGLPAPVREELAAAGSLAVPAVVAVSPGRYRRLSRARRLVPAAIAAVLAVVLLGAAAAAVGPRWTSTRQALYADTGGQRLVAAEDWIAGNVPHDARVVVDDTLWVDLVRRGFDPHRGVIWFYKTDFTNNLDPSVAQTLPNGYRDLGYVVVTPVLRAALEQLPQGLAQLRAAVRYSEVLTTIGTGPERIEVRKVVVPPDAPVLPSPVRP